MTCVHTWDMAWSRVELAAMPFLATHAVLEHTLLLCWSARGAHVPHRACRNMGCCTALLFPAEDLLCTAVQAHQELEQGQ